MKTKLNKPLFAVVVGLAIILPMEFYSQFFKYLGLTNLSTFEYTSLIVSKEPNWWLGILTGPGTAATASLVLYYSAIIWDTDYFPFKGGFIGAITYSFIAILKNLVSEFKMETSGHFVHALGGMAVGMIAGYLMKKYILPNDGVNSDFKVFQQQKTYRIKTSPLFKPILHSRNMRRPHKKPKKYKT